MQRCILSILVSTGIILGSLGLQAAGDSKDTMAPASAASAKVKQMPFHGKVREVDLAARTVTLQGKEKDRLFHLTDQTRIQRDGKPGVLDDVKPGETVGGLARESSAGAWELVTLNVGEKAPKAKERSKTQS